MYDRDDATYDRHCERMEAGADVWRFRATSHTTDRDGDCWYDCPACAADYLDPEDDAADEPTQLNDAERLELTEVRRSGDEAADAICRVLSVEGYDET